MELAISMFLDEKLTPDDERLNYLSHEELGLICPNPKCRELVFFKPCLNEKRIPHFSHFKETGKDCDLKTKNNTNTSKQDTDSESREQSLEKFQIKFKDILDQAIIDNPNQTISDINELKNCKLQGISLVNKYKIDINLWLSLFNKKRESISKLALSLYNKNNELSEIYCRVLANIVDYLCVPASEYILEDTFYYVFYLLNKNVSVNNDYQEVCSKVIELIRYVDKSLIFNEFPSEPIGKCEILNFAKTLGDIGTKLEKEHQRIINEPTKGLNLRKFVGLYGTWVSESYKEIQLEYISGKRKQNKKGKISYVEIKGKSRQKLSICWETNVSGQHLIFKHNSVIVATFSKLNNDSLQWKPLSGLDKLSRQIAIPSWPRYDPILSTSLEQFFLGWLVSQEFAESLSLRSRQLEYLPALVKLLLLYMSYAAERTEIFTETKLLGIDMQVSLDEVTKTYKNLISGLVQDTPHMKRIYELDEILPL
jgi:hypothetical protein